MANRQDATASRQPPRTNVAPASTAGSQGGAPRLRDVIADVVLARELNGCARGEHHGRQAVGRAPGVAATPIPARSWPMTSTPASSVKGVSGA